MNLGAIDRIWFLTWTTYGTWLPGDDRGFVSPKFDGPISERRNNVLGEVLDEGRMDLRRLAVLKLGGPPVRLTLEQARVVRRQIEETARYRGWTVLAGAVMANHVHLVVAITGDPDAASLQRDFKSYASRALNRVFARPRSGTWWTEQGSRRKVDDWENLDVLLRYVREQESPLEVWEQVDDVHGVREGRISASFDRAESSKTGG
jgi:REP element-mobilizing transposase RayT